MTHTKKTYLIAAISIIAAFQACKQQPAFKAIRQQVVSIHDTIMNEDARLTANHAMLVNMITPVSMGELKKADKTVDTALEKAKAIRLMHQLDSVSNAMSDWMGQFNPDIQGKDAQQATNYFSIEKVKVMQLDSGYKALLNTSSNYLKRFHLKPSGSAPMKMKM